MTDKQIIIDGVDVSGCPCIQSNNIGDVVCVRLARTSLYCEGQPCYYKALERKEQECEKWKSAYEVKEDALEEAEEYTEKLEQKLSNKRKECDELHETVKSQKEEIKNLNYTLYEERNLTTDLAKANLKISTLKRDLSSARNRFKNENQQNKEIIKAKEQECKELKKVNRHIEHNRKQKADKLMRIEKLITACSTGYTDDFIQSILAILLEAELTEGKNNE